MSVTEPDDSDDYQVTWWDRQLVRNRFTLWAGSWVLVLWYRARNVYDELMIRLWPYGLLPREWRSLMFWRKEKET